MFKLFWGEVKKIIMRPGIYIMLALLVLVLVLAPNIFKPASRTDGAPQITGATLSDRYGNFESILKPQINGELNASVNLFNSILNNQDADVLKENLRVHFDYTQSTEPASTLRDYYRNFFGIMEQLPQDISGSIAGLNSNISGMSLKLTHLINAYNNLNSDNNPRLLLTKETHEEFLDALTKFDAVLTNFINKVGKTKSDYIDFNTHLLDFQYIPALDSLMNKMQNIKYDYRALQKLYDSYYTEAPQKLMQLDTEISFYALNNPNGNTADVKNELDSKILSYYILANNTTNLLQFGAKLYVDKSYSDSTLSGYMGFENYNRYQLSESLTHQLYLLDNNKGHYEYGNVFAFNQNSGADTSAYDFIYFVLEILSFIFIAYGVVLGASMIAGEQSSGTIKLLAIRPYKRSKIIFAKMCAALFFILLFMLLASVITIIASLFIYGGSSLISSTAILVVFNASAAFTIPAPVLLLIYLCTLIVKIWIFVLLAFAISTLFKSHVGAVIVSTLLYVFSIIVTFVAAGANWLKYIIFANLDFFKYFGGSFINKPSQNSLNNLFLNPVFADSSIIYTSVVVGALLIVLNLITYLVFKYRDIT